MGASFLTPVTPACGRHYNCDGDVTFADGHCSTVIARGSIRSKKNIQLWSSTYSAESDIDVGVDAALKEGVLTVTKLTPGSPLTKSGVKESDVVIRVNEKDIKTANDFRRELRYSVPLEAGIFSIMRGGEKITRVVYFKNGLEK